MSEIDRAIACYKDILGMDFLFKAPPGLEFFDYDGTRLLLDAPAWKNNETHSSIIDFKVADIQKIAQQLENQGVVIETAPHLVAKMPDHDLWMDFFRNPNQNLLPPMREVR